MAKKMFIYLWMGTPISEIPREELERLFIEAQREIDDLIGLNMQAKIEHVHDLAGKRKRYGR